MKKIRAQRTILRAQKFDVDLFDLETSTGHQYSREAIIHGGAVVVLPITEDGRVVMIRNYRFPVGKVLLELCAGTIEAGEDPAVCAGREMIEETGYEANQIEKLMQFYSAPGFCSELLHVYTARELTEVGQALEANEEIEVVLMGWDEIKEAIKVGEIEDAKSIAALLYAMNFGLEG